MADLRLWLRGSLAVAAVALALSVSGASAQDAAGGGAADDDADKPPLYPTAQFADDDAKTATVTAGGVTATIDLVARPDLDPDNDTPMLTVTVGGKQVLQAPGVAGEIDDPPAEASIAEMDKSNALPEVYFVSGCCNTVIVAEQVGDTWETIPIGDFGDNTATLEDLDGDGLAEIATVDINFINRFDCTACSAAPRVIYSVRNGDVVDLTNDPRFLPAHRAWLKELEDSIEPAAKWTSPGFLAGWLGEKIRVGEGADAWQQINAHWDAAKDEGEEVCPNGDDPDTCDKKDRKVLKFPERLRLFLNASGYKF
ncbi:MAG TPA: hypothetical protein VHA70_04570 [Bauldia sp.]|nr:hypothetical protein [Bauldia sp.]